MTLVDHARQFAARAHNGQRYGDAEYMVHLQDVVDVLIEYNFGDDAEMLAAGWLHDAPEDAGVAIQEVQARFGRRVAYIVEGVTNEPGKNRKERAVRTYPKIREDADRVALKLADRLANGRSAKTTNPGLYSMYRKEYPGFRAALRRESEFGGMWGELDTLFEYQDITDLSAAIPASIVS